MTDVDLLKQAATKLRKHTNAAVKQFAADGGLAWADAANGWLGGPIGEFCALLSPEVAEALTELLDETIENLEQFAHLAGGMRDGDLTSTDAAAIAVARAILRGEPEAHAHTWIEPTFPGFPRFCMCGARENES
jgi:hypothetical protein